MDLSEGFHREVIDTRKSIDDVDFSESSTTNNIDTSPLNSGGANFKTHVLVKKSSSKLAYKPSIGGALFSFLFLVIGIAVIILSILSFTDLLSIPPPGNWMLFVFGAIFGSVGGYMCYRSYMPRVFDKQLGLYYKTYKVDLHISKNDSKNQLPLKSIIAIQIIGEHVRSDNGSYKSFELNLVLEDDSRKNVVDHGNLKSIIDDAHIISEFLNVPIWHSKSNEA
ncbi:hypothetical protein [Winogradskyella sp.]|uniref:hypothetical protein n=1 Tax=Winogradskyella sp. TaxID=1883156 RepID=UPI0025D115C0|nr:hypothetical protein [Winogradskyella sp.]